MIERENMEHFLEDNIEKCIKALLEKFLKWPNNFFTESDAHSYLYYYFFRSGAKALKQFYSTNDSEKQKKQKTVLIHREYPTSFRYQKETMQLDEKKGGRGHYDLVVLDPEFVKAHELKQIIAKNYKTDCVKNEMSLLASIEFKLIVKPLDRNVQDQIEKDFQKLEWAVEKNQAKQSYMIIFNRYREEKRYKDKVIKQKKLHPKIKGIYLESIVNPQRLCEIIYLNEWKYKLRFNRRCLVTEVKGPT